MVFFKSKKLRRAETRVKQRLEIERLRGREALLERRAKVEKLRTDIVKSRRVRRTAFAPSLRVRKSEFSIIEAKQSKKPSLSVDERIGRIF